MAYAIDWTRVADEVAAFPEHVRQSWDACLREVAANPHARFGYYVDRGVGGLPMRTWVYEIAEEVSISGLVVQAFTGDFFPEYAPVYTINEKEQVVIMLFLRENDRA